MDGEDVLSADNIPLPPLHIGWRPGVRIMLWVMTGTDAWRQFSGFRIPACRGCVGCTR